MPTGIGVPVAGCACPAPGQAATTAAMDSTAVVQHIRYAANAVPAVL
jgi:hypothetical protein